jgi:hypothetical protein
VATDAPVTGAAAGAGQLPARAADPRLLAELDERWGLGSSLGRLLSAMAANPG